jgi:co-chaperonin GroES (HSP10)
MLTPCGKRILVKPVEVKQGSLILPGVKPTQYEVIAVSGDSSFVWTHSIVYLQKHSGVEIEHDGQKYLVVDEQDILAKVD